MTVVQSQTQSETPDMPVNAVPMIAVPHGAGHWARALLVGLIGGAVAHRQCFSCSVCSASFSAFRRRRKAFLTASRRSCASRSSFRCLTASAVTTV